MSRSGSARTRSGTTAGTFAAAVLTLRGILPSFRVPTAPAGASALSPIAPSVTHAWRRTRGAHSDPHPSGVMPESPMRSCRRREDLDVCVFGGDGQCVECALSRFVHGRGGHYDPLHASALGPQTRQHAVHRLRRLRVRPSPEVRRLWIRLGCGSGAERPRRRPRFSEASRRDEEARPADEAARRLRLGGSGGCWEAARVRRTTGAWGGSGSSVLLLCTSGTAARRSARRSARAARRAASASSALRDRWFGIGRSGSGTVSASMTSPSLPEAAMDCGGFIVA